MLDFGKIESSFQKMGSGLTEAEAEVIRQFIFSENISPNFVAYMIKQYGHASINQAFLFDDLADEIVTSGTIHRLDRPGIESGFTTPFQGLFVWFSIPQALPEVMIRCPFRA